MLIIDVTARNGIDERFMTNNDGRCLFILRDGASKQVDCESGYDSLPRIKKAIREHLRYLYGSLPRLHFKSVADGWKEDEYRIDGLNHVYFYSGKNRTGLHIGRVLPGETKLEALRRIKSNHAEAKKLEAAGYTPADFEVMEG